MAGTAFATANPHLWTLLGHQTTVDDLAASISAVTTGTLWLPASRFSTASSSTLSVYTRNAAGDYSWNTTAGGAETHYFTAPFNIPTRTTSGKGIKITGGRLSYAIGVAAATTVDVTLNQVTYVDSVANSVSTTHGGVLTYGTGFTTNALRVAVAGGVNPHLLTFTLGTPAFVNSGSIALVLEATIVLANTGTLKVQGAGVDFTVFDLGA